jgi:hypothetical protein
MGKLRWYLKQLTPRTYWTNYGRSVDDATLEGHFCIWKMWLGRCYDVIDIPTGPDSTWNAVENVRWSSPPVPKNDSIAKCNSPFWWLGFGRAKGVA